MILIEIQEIFLITILPLMHLIGFICNIICVKIFSSQKKFKNNIYRYLTVNSIIDAIFLLLLMFVPFTQCFSICKPWLNVYFLNFYKKYASAYFCRVLDMISSLINVTIVIDRYLCLAEVRLKRKNLTFLSLLIVFTLFSTLLFMPNMLFLDISKSKKLNETIDFFIDNIILDSSIGYTLERTKYSKSNLIRRAIMITQYLISLFCLVAVAGGSAMLIYELRKRLKSSRKIEKFSIILSKRRNSSLFNNNERMSMCVQNGFILVKRKTGQSATRNITIMVVLMSIFLLVHQIAIQIISTAFILMDRSSVKYNFIVIFYNICAYLFHGANIFIYYFYSKDFSFKLRFLFLKHQKSTKVRIKPNVINKIKK
jgi:hypothetical protein